MSSPQRSVTLFMGRLLPRSMNQQKGGHSPGATRIMEFLNALPSGLTERDSEGDSLRPGSAYRITRLDGICDAFNQ
jgi:hypothetical protein